MTFLPCGATQNVKGLPVVISCLLYTMNVCTKLNACPSNTVAVIQLIITSVNLMVVLNGMLGNPQMSRTVYKISETLRYLVWKWSSVKPRH